MIPAFHPHGQFHANLAAFCATLREQHGFSIGPGETADAARAADYVGVANLERIRDALRLALCANPEQAHAFDAAFDAFFLPHRQGVRQRNLNPRHTRPQPPNQPPPRTAQTPAAPPPRPTASDGETDDAPAGGARRRLATEDQADDAPHQGLMRARYSAMAGESASPEVPGEGLDAMLEAAGALVRRLRLGRSRRWHSMPAGTRFDFRRTLRAGLQTGGETLHPRWQGHPRRNPRIVVAVDGSRSMSEHAGLMLQFAYALSQRTRRLDAFVFSTELRDVTPQLRGFARGQPVQLANLSDAWGGGTRIGACLDTLVRDHGHRCLTEHTVVLVLSDGLDVGDPERLRAALRELRRRSAALVWLNPLLGTPGYAPDAQGMRAALPYLDAFIPAGDPGCFAALARSLTL